MVSAAAKPFCGRKVNSHWLGPNSISSERGNAAPDRLQCRVDLIEAGLGEILIPLIEEAHLGRLRRPGGVLWRQTRVFQLEQMKFDFKPGEEVEPFSREPRQRVAKNLARRERDRLTVGEIDIAQQPAGIRRPIILRPRQHLKGRRVGDHDEIAAALHLRHCEAAAGGEHRIDRLVRRVFGEQRRRHGGAALHQRRDIGGHDGLAAQYAMLVSEGKPHQFEFVFRDGPLDRLRLARLIDGPQAVTLDEADRGGAATLCHA
jgi:hypothetical protein